MRLLILALLFFIAYSVISAFLRSLAAPRQQTPPEKSAAGEDMERDPQCGTYVPRSDAISKAVAGTTHYFCSTACRDAWLAKRK